MNLWRLYSSKKDKERERDSERGEEREREERDLMH